MPTSPLFSSPEMSWFNDKTDDNSSQGINRWQSRRHFDWDTPTIQQEYTDPTTFNPGSYLDSDITKGTIADTSGYTEAANRRMTDAAMSGLGSYAGAVGLGALGIQGMRTIMGAPDVGFSNVLSGVAGASAPTAISGLAGRLLGSAYGISPTSGTSITASGVATALGKILNPALGLFASVAGPIVGEGVGKLVGMRQNEVDKKAYENATGAGFLDTSAAVRTITDAAKAKDSLVDDMSQPWDEVNPYTGEVTIDKTIGYNDLDPASQSTFDTGTKAKTLGEYASAAYAPANTFKYSNYQGLQATDTRALSEASKKDLENVMGITPEQTIGQIDAFNAYGPALASWNADMNVSIPTPTGLSFSGRTNENSSAMGRAKELGLASYSANDVTGINDAANVGNLGDISSHVRDAAIQGRVNIANANAAASDADKDAANNSGASSVNNSATDNSASGYGAGEGLGGGVSGMSAASAAARGLSTSRDSGLGNSSNSNSGSSAGPSGGGTGN